ncbi:MAG: hypothetical protein EU549_00505 [Promethearchaeota archaeon]|nr:MAG: hypothetical protein EU549_00505 [Candidatus Lokiarchaeota archaeon]
MEYIDKNSIVNNNRISAGANIDITPEFTATLGAAYGTFLEKGVVVLARDYRTDSRMLKRSFAAGLMSAGINVLDIHEGSTSTLRFSIRRFGATGGVMFTSGHLMKGKTAIKFYNGHGIEYGIDFIKKMFSIMNEKKINRVKPDEVGQISTSEDIDSIYNKAMAQFIDKELLAESDLRIVMDCANGPLGDTAPQLFSNLDIDVVAINTFKPYKSFKNLPDIESIRKVSRIVSSANADLGMACDVDASRVIFFMENGAVIDSDLLITLFFMDLLDRDIKNPIVITSQTTTRMLDELAKEYNVTLIRVDNIPGEISSKIRLKMGNLGISDGGKVRFPVYAPFTDIILVALKLCEIIARTNDNLSNLISQCPQSIKMQEDLTVKPDVFHNYNFYLEKIEDKIIKYVDTLFGVKLFFGNDKGFVNIIPQLYFDRLRLSAELNDTCDASELFSMIKEVLTE